MNPLPIDPKNLPLVNGDPFQGNLAQILLMVILLGAVAYLLLQHGLIKSKMMAKLIQKKRIEIKKGKIEK